MENFIFCAVSKHDHMASNYYPYSTAIISLKFKLIFNFFIMEILDCSNPILTNLSTVYWSLKQVCSWKAPFKCGYLYTANIYLFKVTNRNTRKRCKICSKLTIKTSKRSNWCCSGVFIFKFERILHLFLVFLLMILNK